MANPIPSKQPNATDNLATALLEVFKKSLQNVDAQLPAVVISYDRVKNIAQVRPLVAMLTTGSKSVSRAPVCEIPVLALGGGGFFLSFPLKPGDLGWIEASDRDITLFMQSLSEQLPNTKRLHSFEDCRFIPDVFRQYTINSVDNNSLVLSSTDGTVRVALSPNKATITAPTVQIDTTALNINAATITTRAGVIDTIATGAATFKAATLAIDAIMSNSKATSLDGGATISTKPFLTHTHTGVSTGSNNSGGVT